MDVTGDLDMEVVVGNRGSANKVYTIKSVLSGNGIEITLLSNVGALSGGGRTDDTRAVTVRVPCHQHYTTSRPAACGLFPRTHSPD